MKNKLSNLNCIEEENMCAGCQNCPCAEDYDLDDECDECEDCPCFNDGFDLGFKKGHQAAREELMEDIYISGQKIDKIDNTRKSVLALGYKISSEYNDTINRILEGLSDLIKDEALEAVDEYLGYR